MWPLDMTDVISSFQQVFLQDPGAISSFHLPFDSDQILYSLYQKQKKESLVTTFWQDKWLQQTIYLKTVGVCFVSKCH